MKSPEGDVSLSPKTEFFREILGSVTTDITRFVDGRQYRLHYYYFQPDLERVKGLTLKAYEKELVDSIEVVDGRTGKECRVGIWVPDYMY